MVAKLVQGGEKGEEEGVFGQSEVLCGLTAEEGLLGRKVLLNYLCHENCSLLPT